MLKKLCPTALGLVFTACSSAPPPGVSPMTLLEARVNSLEAQLEESRAAHDRLSAAFDELSRSSRVAPKAPKAERRPNVKKSRQSPISKESPGKPGPLKTEKDTDREATQVVADSRHEGLHRYREGLNHLRDRRFDEAVEAFRRFVTENPNHVYVDRAQYLIAEAHYGNKEYGLAVVAAGAVESKYPTSFRVPDAIYTRALALLHMGQRGPAGDALRDVVRRFPREPVAELASRRLAELSVAIRSHEDVPLLPEAGT